MADRAQGQCGKRVTHLVRHPQWKNDYYLVCEKHLEWAKARIGLPVTVTLVPTGSYQEITSGCVWWDATKHPTPRNRLPLPKDTA